MRDWKEQRRSPRWFQQARFRLDWTDRDGTVTGITGNSIDLSKSGARLKLDRKIDPQTMVRVECPELRVFGMGMVRHSRHEGLKFLTGLQLSSGAEIKDILKS